MPEKIHYVIHYFNAEGPDDPETGLPSVVPLDYDVYGEDSLKEWSDIIRIQYGCFGEVTWTPPHEFPPDPVPENPPETPVVDPIVDPTNPVTPVDPPVDPIPDPPVEE